VEQGEAWPSPTLLAQIAFALDADTGEIVASAMTGNDVNDAGQVPVLLEQIDAEIASVTADGAYDGEPVYSAVASRQSDKPPDVIIPPRSSAVPDAPASDAQSQRDGHTQFIAKKGRMAWQKATGYDRSSLIETAIGRYKSLISPKRRARTFPNQQGEIAVAVGALNRMIRVAKPVSVRVP